MGKQAFLAAGFVMLNVLQAERELRQRLKAAFKHFIDRVEGITHGQVEFDVPFRELGYVLNVVYFIVAGMCF